MDEVHVVSKIDNSQHASFNLQATVANEVVLRPSSIRVRTALVGLSSNNLGYARGGAVLHWWDTYPVPAGSPTPYDDSSLWGIVPAWGYAVVLESTTDIAPGSLIFGFWPTCTFPTDLELVAAEPKGQWTEVSAHRSKLMNVYNRYSEVRNAPISGSLKDTNLGNEKFDELAWTALIRGIWEGAYLLSQHVFAPRLLNPVHPLGSSFEWTSADADLSSAILVSLSAAGKTARSFAYHISHRPASTGPLGFLQVTSSPGAISAATEALNPSLLIKTVAYDELPEAADWMLKLKSCKKIVIVDFGAQGNALEQFLETVKSHPTLQSLAVVIIQVGGQQKVYKIDELLEMRAAMSRLGKIQYNTSGVQDTIMQRDGVAAYLDTLNSEWEQWLQNRQINMPDVRIVWGRGISGAEGIEGGWKRLCEGNVGAGEALAYQM